MSPTVVQLRAIHDELLGGLSCRASARHFAHAAIALLLGVVATAAAGKLLWDFGELYRGVVAAGAMIGVGLLVYAVLQYAMGRRALAGEHAAFERLEGLRRELKLDDPSALLP